MNKKELIERMEGLNKLYGDNKNYVSYIDVIFRTFKIACKRKMGGARWFCYDLEHGIKKQKP